MGKPFSTYDYDDAANLVGSKVALPRDGTRDYPLPSVLTTSTNLITDRARFRRSQIALDATAFYEGDHWLDSRGFIGQLPPRGLPGQPAMLQAIRDGFVSENVVKEVVNTHVGGILGREPSWSFLKAQTTATATADRDQETGDTLTPWWNKRKALKDLQKALRIALCEGLSVRRLFIPKQYGSTLIATDIPTALNSIYFETVHADRGGVFLDPDTQQEIGIFLYEEHDNNGDITRNCAELSFLADDGSTICRVVRDDDTSADYGPYQLGGHLLIYQIEREVLITEQVQANQRAVNLAHTMMIRNVNLAGARERTITNAQPPLPATDKPTITKDTTKVAGKFPGNYKVGPNAVNFVMGVPLRDENGNIVGYTNPTVNLADPVSVESFEKTIDKEKEAIYAQCHQRHVLIVDKADTSGRAREVARKEYERSLKESKTELDACGRWQLEVTLRLAAQISGQVNRYATLRADFNTLIDAGQPDPAFVQQVLEMRKPGGPRLRPVLSDETARELCGVEDAAAELAKIQKEELQPPADPTPMPKTEPDPLTQPSGAVN